MPDRVNKDHDRQAKPEPNTTFVGSFDTTTPPSGRRHDSSLTRLGDCPVLGGREDALDVLVDQAGRRDDALADRFGLVRPMGHVETKKRGISGGGVGQPSWPGHAKF